MVIAVGGMLQSCAATRYRVAVGDIVTYIQLNPSPESDEFIAEKRVTVNTRPDTASTPWCEVLKGQTISHQLRIDSLKMKQLSNAALVLGKER